MLMIKTTTRKFINIYILFFICDYFLDGFNITDDTFSVIAIVGLFTLGQVFIKPVLELVSFPFKTITLGFTEIIIDSLLIAILAFIFKDYLQITSNQLTQTFDNLMISSVVNLNTNIQLNFIINIIIVAVLLKIIHYITKAIVF